MGGGEERGHHIGIGIDSARASEVDVGGIAGEGHTDEVDQVIAGESPRQGERAQQDDHLEHIDA